MQKSMAFARSGRVWVMVHGARDVADADWDAYIRALGTISDAERTIVFTEGPSPNPKQRARLNEKLGGSTPKTAVVSESLAVRGSVLALSLFNGGIRAFSPSELDAALAHLGLNAVEQAFVKDTARALKLQVR